MNKYWEQIGNLVIKMFKDNTEIIEDTVTVANKKYKFKATLEEIK